MYYIYISRYDYSFYNLRVNTIYNLFTILHSIVMLCKQVTQTKCEAHIWGGVEVIEVVRGCTSIGSLSFPLNSAFRAIYSFVQEQRHSASPCFSCTSLFTHSDTAEKYRRSSKLSEVYCISLKLVKSNYSD